MGLVRDGREWVYGPLCRFPGVLHVCVCDVCVCGVCGPPVSFLRRGLIAGVLLVRLVLRCEELRTTAPLVLRCDELRTPAVIHIPPQPDPPIPRRLLSIFSVLPVIPGCEQDG